MKKFLLYLSVILFPILVNADQCGSWGCIAPISVLYTNANGDIYIGTPLDETLANCTPVSSAFFTLNSNAENAKEIYSSLLAAYMSGKKINMRVIEGSPKCELAYVVLDSSY